MSSTRSRVRPLLVFKCQTNEVLCITQDEFSCKNAEWIEIENLNGKVEINSDEKD